MIDAEKVSLGTLVDSSLQPPDPQSATGASSVDDELEIWVVGKQYSNGCWSFTCPFCGVGDCGGPHKTGNGGQEVWIHRACAREFSVRIEYIHGPRPSKLSKPGLGPSAEV